MIKPLADYLLVEVVNEQRGAITSGDAEDTWQKGKVLAISQYADEVIDAVREGDTVYWQKHAESDTPPDLKQNGQELIKFERLMAVERNK